MGAPAPREGKRLIPVSTHDNQPALVMLLFPLSVKWEQETCTRAFLRDSKHCPSMGADSVPSLEVFMVAATRTRLA